MVAVNIELKESPNKELAAYAAALSPPRRPALHTAISDTMAYGIRSHLDGAAGTRHKTANKLGADPTNYIKNKAVGNTKGEADADSARVIIHSDPSINFDARGLARAWQPLTIRPREKEWLTIPVHAISYGKRIKDLPAGMKVFRPVQKGGTGKRNVLAAIVDGKFTPLYALSKGVAIPQDSGLLPQKPSLLKMASNAVIGFLKNERSTGK